MIYISSYEVFCQVWIDNFVFRLHSRVTVLILFASCIIVSIGQFFGDPIDCLVDVSICDKIGQPHQYNEHFFYRKKFRVVLWILIAGFMVLSLSQS